MLVEFRVKNFRSFRDEQVLSFVAANDKSLRDTNTITTGRKEAPFLLRSAVLYGANGSGKSNLISAIRCMRNLLLYPTPLQEDGAVKDVELQPFKLNEQPIEFEVTLIKGGIRYQYGFAVTEYQFVEEHLIVYRADKAQRWFVRYFNPATQKDVYKFSEHLLGQTDLWQNATSRYSLFLPKVIGYGNQLMRPIYDWFEKELVIISDKYIQNMYTSIQLLQKKDGFENLGDFLKSMDISITDIDESKGAKKIRVLAGPILSIASKELTVMVDDLDTNLHTLVVRKLVQMFHSSRINTMGSQLLFTAHDTSLMDVFGLFRRDQIWLVDKNQEQASTLGSISDFKPRKNESIQEGYLAGRYGGIPFLSDL